MGLLRDCHHSDVLFLQVERYLINSQSALEPLLLKSIPAFSRKVVAKGARSRGPPLTGSHNCIPCQDCIDMRDAPRLFKIKHNTEFSMSISKWPFTQWEFLASPKLFQIFRFWTEWSDTSNWSLCSFLCDRFYLHCCTMLMATLILIYFLAFRPCVISCVTALSWRSIS